MRISRNLVMITLAIWTFSYILGVILTERFVTDQSGYLFSAVSRSLLWPILIVSHFLFLRKIERADFDYVWLLSLYAMFTGWILFSVGGVKGLSLILSIPIVFLSGQFFRLGRTSYGDVIKHIKSGYLGSLSFSFSLVILLTSLSFFYSKETASILLLFLLIIPASLLTHFRADFFSGIIFAWFSFAIGFINIGFANHVAVAGFSLGPIFLLLAIFSCILASEDPSKRVFATVNPREPVDEASLRIETDPDESRLK
ncbi:MAG: hypothetical protein PHD38_10445 [Mesotoga sp.]|uniref:hypothetical protein n=1 Tax=unclassified Mesotoga TaxID=1184398 RepID=UPI00217ED161|nr:MULTISPECIES: hypothetical protein [unclassified Mesotoga]MDI9368357.1 hypothetical protein [Thermotogota bacterium]MDD2334810.1 hypothetical protein [Mesotoga sp.]MDD3680699.1 hypothetical protein [Mesotoga sp.]MDD4206836.1 hypothetical protein [Mesotoga sp.]MDD4825096.1 hypothetical protein [Mesotoga sp.]